MLEVHADRVLKTRQPYKHLMALKAKRHKGMLRLICEYFDLDVGNIPRLRKVPYIELISSLVQTCADMQLCSITEQNDINGCGMSQSH